MTTSDSIAALVAALVKAQPEFKGAAKSSVNPHFKSKYADLAEVEDACLPALNKHGIAVLQPVRADGPAVTITTVLAHTSGEFIAEDLTMTAVQNTPQAIGSAITYGRRYGLAAMVGVAPEDDDGHAATTGPVVYAPGTSAPSTAITTALPRVDLATGEELGASVPNVPDSGIPAGAYLIQRVQDGKFGSKGYVTLDRPRTGQAGDDRSFPIYKDQLRTLAEELCQLGAPCFVEFKESANHKWRIEMLTRVPANYDPYQKDDDGPAPDWNDINEDSIPF